MYVLDLITDSDEEMNNSLARSLNVQVLNVLKTAFIWLVNSLKMKGLLSFVLEEAGEKLVEDGEV